MTHLQLDLAKKYETDGYTSVLQFWASRQEEIANLTKEERGKLKAMMKRYCLINGDTDAAAKVVQENSAPQNKEIMPLLFEFGKACYLGTPTEKNKDKSERIYSLIQQHGGSEDLFHLGEMYMAGTEIEQNYVKAVECLRKSAMDGNRCAQFILGEMYSTGRGVDKNRAEAEKWYMAANGENTQYATSLTKMVIPDGITVIEASAFEGFESLRSVKIPVSVKEIGAGAFCGCRNLDHADLDSSKISLGRNAFKDCNLDEESSRVIGKIEYIFVQGNWKINSFYIGKYPVTQKLYEEVIGYNPARFKKPNHPVERVTLFDAVKFCNALSIKEGLTPCYDLNNECDSCANGYRLPTEKEWLYAARGGIFNDSFKYSGSNNIDEIAWYRENSGESTHPVGMKKPNSLGIFDMSGNVWEMAKEKTERKIFFLGGGWGSSGSDCKVRSSFEINGVGTSYRKDFVGFRVVRSCMSEE